MVKPVGGSDPQPLNNLGGGSKGVNKQAEETKAKVGNTAVPLIVHSRAGSIVSFGGTTVTISKTATPEQIQLVANFLKSGADLSEIKGTGLGKIPILEIKTKTQPEKKVSAGAMGPAAPANQREFSLQFTAMGPVLISKDVSIIFNKGASKEQIQETVDFLKSGGNINTCKNEVNLNIKEIRYTKGK